MKYKKQVQFAFLTAGGAAGGHLAAAMGTVDGFNEVGDELSISCVPAALVLFNLVANNGPKGYSYNRLKDYCKTFLLIIILIQITLEP